MTTPSIGTLVLIMLFLYCSIDDDYSDGNNGVSAFSSTFSSSSASSLRSIIPKRTTSNTQRRIKRILELEQPYSFTVYNAKDPTPATNSKQELKSTPTTTNNNKNKTDEQQQIPNPPPDVTAPLALLLTSQFLLFIGVGAVIPSIPLYGKALGLSSSTNGLMISAPAITLFLLANPSGRTADIARKPAMLLGMAIIAISDLGTALAPSILPLILARLGLGAGRALSEAGERGMLVDLANRVPEVRGRVLAVQQAVIGLGIAIGAVVGGVVVEGYGVRSAFYCVSVAAVVSLGLYSFLPETVGGTGAAVESLAGSSAQTLLEDSVLVTDDYSNEEGEVLNEKTSGIQVWTELLKQNQWRGLALCQSGTSFGFAAKIASIPILATSTLPGGAVGAGTLVSAAGLSGLIGAPIGGYITDRIGAKGAAVISGIISSIGLILVPLALLIAEDELPYSNIELAIGGVVLQSKALFFSLAVLLWSLGASAQGPALTALAQKKSLLGVEATSLSLVKAAGDGTYIIAPFLLGLVADALVEFPGIECALAGSTTLLGTVALFILVEQDSNDSNSDGSTAIDSKAKTI